jgi:hypothetical protein
MCGRQHDKPLGDYVPAQLLFLPEPHEVMTVVWFVIVTTICAAIGIFMWRFDRYLEKLTGPWISN